VDSAIVFTTQAITKIEIDCLIELTIGLLCDQRILCPQHTWQKSVP